MRWRFVIAAVAIGVAVLASLYLVGILCFQRRLLFPRPIAENAVGRPSDSLQVWLPTPVGRVEAWYLPPIGTVAKPAPTIIFFHGNAELIDYQPDQFAEPRRWGVGVLLVEFPGYGRSEGAPSQRAIAAAALAAHDWAHGQATIDGTRIVAYGRSLGGAAAAILAGNRPIAALVLESTFTSVRSFAHRFWVPEFAVLDPFDSVPLVESYKGPVLVLHGDQDEIVPRSQAEVMARASGSSELHFLPCGHNDCARAWGTIRAFLSRAGVITN